MPLTPAQRLKFRLFAEGLTVTAAARRRLDERRGARRLTPADYASTTGLILRLADEVWVNAPMGSPAGDGEPPRTRLDLAGDGWVVHGNGLESPADVWLPPRYHQQRLTDGRPVNHFAFTHGDRVRLSPLRGCAMRCEFCNIPYEDPYALKPIDSMLEALRTALVDPLQPAHHVMISGGTPGRRDVPFLRGVYERILGELPSTRIDIMMVPVDDLLDVQRLAELGVHQLSINIELFDEASARQLMPQKYKHGIRRYLDFIAEATGVLGPERVRSMIMVGLEDAGYTLAGVQAILEAGGVPVLSPFRPAASTPLADRSVCSASEYEEIFLRASDLAAAAGGALGPSCPPCTHNTLTLIPPEAGRSAYEHPLPVMV